MSRETREKLAGAETTLPDPGPAAVVNPLGLDEVTAAPARGSGESPGNLDLILDVDVPLTVCIGSVRKSIGEILSLGEGQVVDLERVAGEPVDLLVNGKLIARGEVVVVDEHYAFRISEIVAPSERLAVGPGRGTPGLA